MVDLRKALLVALIAYVAFIGGLFVAHMANGYHAEQQAAYETRVQQLNQEYDEASAAFNVKHGPTYQQIVDEENAVKKDCRPAFYNLSPREQMLRVNEVLGTPNEQEPRRE